MSTRRDFLKTAVTGAAVSVSTPTLVSAMVADQERKLKPIRIGIMVPRTLTLPVSVSCLTSRRNFPGWKLPTFGVRQLSLPVKLQRPEKYPIL
jgi:hypothetical protein